MPRRVNLPGVDEFFGAAPSAPEAPAKKRGTTKQQPTGPSGRVRHDEKITVYVSIEELLSLEQARLQLRAQLGLNIDRGRLVREAIDMMLEDLAAQGSDSAVARRLQQ